MKKELKRCLGIAKSWKSGEDISFEEIYTLAYTGKEIKFYFYKDDYKIELTANNKEEMYIKLLELFEKGLNNWINAYENDSYKTKRERHRLNGYKRLLFELNKVVDICYS